ncbi:MAG: ATP-binding protein [Bacteriovorax sp.]|nr:ATP-binding protein [Bacteriovorax sp.]
MNNEELILKKLNIEFCKRSIPAAIALIISATPLLFFPLIAEGPFHQIFMILVALTIPVNIIRIFLAHEIGKNKNYIPRNLELGHFATLLIYALCSGLFIGLSLWSLSISSIGFMVSIIIITAISGATTSSLVLNPRLQLAFLFLVAIIPTIELFVMSVIRKDSGYGLIAMLIAVFTGYVIAHSRNYYKQMTQLYEYEEQLLSEKQQLQIIVDELSIAQKEIVTQKARADQASQLAAIGEMASGIAHEINNPLSIIQGNIKRIEILANANTEIDELDKTQFSDRSEKINKSITRISRIINGLKLFSRQKNDENNKNVNFKSILDNSLDLCRERFSLNLIDLEIGECPDVEVNIDEAQISQVLTHLLNNSFEAVRESKAPRVKIYMALRNNFLIISVTDNGTGVPLDIRHKIFRPFFTSKEIGKGQGLGLSISREIIEQHGGVLFLEEEGLKDEEAFVEETTFTFTLPLI